MRPQILRRGDPQQNVRGEERAEEHHFGGEKEPDADFSVVKASVGPCFASVGDFHFRKRIVYTRKSCRSVLRSVVAGLSRDRIFVRTAMNLRSMRKIAVRRRSRGLPFQSGGLPWIIRFDLLSVINAPEEVKDERKLRQS